MAQRAQRQVEVQGVQIPVLGFGTWMLDGSDCVEAVVDALAIGYRLVDTAEAYGNETEVGLGIDRSGIDRRDAWVTTKVWWEDLDFDACVRSVEQSLERLACEWLDLCLIHWPNEDQPLEEPLRALTRLREDGTVRQIGVSNFTPTLLERARESAPIFCNQVEYHPFLSQEALCRTARERDVLLTAYCPLARGRVSESETLQEIGERHGKSAAQVALRWLVQQPNVAAIPKASDPDHRRKNIEVFDFSLDEGEMKRIHGLDEGLRIVDPAHAPSWERVGA